MKEDGNPLKNWTRVNLIAGAYLLAYQKLQRQLSNGDKQMTNTVTAVSLRSTILLMTAPVILSWHHHILPTC